MCSLGVRSSWYEALLLLFLAKARASSTGAGGHGGFPCVTAAYPAWPPHRPMLTIPYAHIPRKSAPALM